MEHLAFGGPGESEPDQCGLTRTVPSTGGPCVTDERSFSGDDAGNRMPTGA